MQQKIIDHSQRKTDSSINSSTSVNPDKEQLIFASAIDFIYHNQTSIIFVILLMQLAIFITMWRQVDHTLLISWILVGFTIVTWRYSLVLSYQKKEKIDSPQLWGYYYAANMLAAGILWGCATFLFFVSGSVINQVFLIVISIGIPVGSLMVNTYYLPSFFMIATPILFATMARLFMEPNIEHHGLAVLLFAYFGLVAKIAKNTNKIMIDTLRLRFENLDLIQQLREQKDVAEEANLAKSKFLAAASHDLRQPLHAMSLFTGLLNSDNNKQRQHDLIGKINRSQSALTSLLNTLLDISRLDAGIVKASMCDFKLDDLITSFIQEFESEGREKGLTVRYIPTDAVIHSDPALLEIILRNLLSNGINYTHEGSVTLQVSRPQNTVHKSGLRIEIIDTGIGIPLARQQEIFEEFHQLSNPERDRSKGLGLGLAIVRRVSELLKHDIEVESSPDAGSKFFIYLTEGDNEQIISATTDNVSVSQYTYPDTVVLFIDDEQEIREGMQDTLSQWGCIAVVAKSADDAVVKLKARQLQPDIIISDYRLQDGKNGADAINQIYNVTGAKVPALIITGDTAPERLREAEKSGYTLLHKPLQPAQIRAFIRNALYPPGS